MLWRSFVLLLGVAIAFGCQRNARTPSDMYALLSQTRDQAYFNGKWLEANPFDRAVTDSFLQSNDATVRELAEIGTQLGILYHLRFPGKSKPISAEELEKLRSAWIKGLANHMAADEDLDSQVRTLGGTIEALVGPETFGTTFEISVNGMIEHVARTTFQDKVREWARQGATKADASNAVTFEADPNGPNMALITNRSASTLHHCIIVTHLFTDVPRVLARQAPFKAINEEAAKGMSPEAAKLFLAGCNISFTRETLDAGAVTYLPDLPPGASVSVGFGNHLSDAKGGSLSLWSDELSVEDRPLTGLGTTRQVRDMSRYPDYREPDRPRYNVGGKSMTFDEIYGKPKTTPPPPPNRFREMPPRPRREQPDRLDQSKMPQGRFDPSKLPRGNF